MFHQEDERSLRRILGTDEIPDKVLREYELRLNMFHRDGNSGPLRTLGLIDLVRSLKCRPPVVEKPPAENFDWRTVPQDGSARVEVRLSKKEWSPGCFLGFVNFGTLAVRLDADPYVRECVPIDVRFVEIVDLTKETDGPDKRIELLDVPPPEVAEEPKPEPEELPNEDALPPFRWAEVQEGESVWVKDADDVKDAKFIKIEKAGHGGNAITIQVQVQDEEKPREVPTPLVTYAGEGQPIEEEEACAV